jgi:hypothetical protein
MTGAAAAAESTLVPAKPPRPPPPKIEVLNIIPNILESNSNTCQKCTLITTRALAHSQNLLYVSFWKREYRVG